LPHQNCHLKIAASKLPPRNCRIKIATQNCHSRNAAFKLPLKIATRKLAIRNAASKLPPKHCHINNNIAHPRIAALRLAHQDYQLRSPRRVYMITAWKLPPGIYRATLLRPNIVIARSHWYELLQHLLPLSFSQIQDVSLYHMSQI
jgi:hypothetical protein